MERIFTEIQKQDRVERIVNNCVADLAFEGMTATEEDKEAIRRIARGETTAEQEVAAVIKKYQEDSASSRK